MEFVKIERCRGRGSSMKTRVENIVSIFARHVPRKSPPSDEDDVGLLASLREFNIGRPSSFELRPRETTGASSADYSAICVRFLCSGRQPGDDLTKGLLPTLPRGRTAGWERITKEISLRVTCATLATQRGTSPPSHFISPSFIRRAIVSSPARKISRYFCPVFNVAAWSRTFSFFFFSFFFYRFRFLRRSAESFAKTSREF